MREDYKIKGDIGSASFEVEKKVLTTLKEMAEHTKLSCDEIVNTALKRFIATHSDFLPRPKG